MRPLFVTSLAIALAACAVEDTEHTPTQSDQSSVSGWLINPEGDLNSFFDCLASNGATLVSAHRGGPQAGFPENTLATMQAILEEAPALMEIDVATSADGVLYLMHDDTLDRTTNGSGRADGRNWNDIRSLALVDNDGNSTPYRPSRFDETLRWAKDRTILQVDFKQSTRYEDVADEINRQDAQDRVILIAYSMASARKLHRLLPGAMISLSLNSQSELNRAVASGIPANRLLGFTGTETPRERLFSLLTSRDVEIIFGTLGGRNSIDRDIAATGDTDLYNQIAALGVDVLATDRPITAHNALREDGRAPQAGTCGVSYQ